MHKPKIVRSVEEIQRVHDLLHPLATGEDGPYIPDDVRGRLRCSLDSICWILGHECGKTFEENMERLEAELKRFGYELKRPS